MNLSLEAYDWWATQVPTKYQTLETNSESDQNFDNINEEKKYDLFDEYIQVWVLPHPLIFKSSIYQPIQIERVQWNLSVYHHKYL